jgi:hypothetical protein
MASKGIDWDTAGLARMLGVRTNTLHMRLLRRRARNKTA